MSYLKNIITYFFHHPASDGVVERVHQRLADRERRGLVRYLGTDRFSTGG